MKEKSITTGIRRNITITTNIIIIIQIIIIIIIIIIITIIIIIIIIMSLLSKRSGRSNSKEKAHLVLGGDGGLEPRCPHFGLGARFEIRPLLLQLLRR
jgi:hypothetical protein